jgi:hypothetical protein
MFALVNVALLAVLLVVCFAILKEMDVLKKMKEEGELLDEDEL